MSLRLQLALAFSGVAALCFTVAWLVGSVVARNVLLQMAAHEQESQTAELAAITETAFARSAAPTSVLAEHLRSIPAVTPNVAYAYLEGPDHLILAHTDPRYEGKSAKQWRDTHPSALEYTGRARMGGGGAATVHLGVSEDQGGALFSDARRMLLPATLIFGGVGVVFTLVVGFGLAFVVTRPVLQIASAANRVGEGDLSVEVPSGAPGEMGALARQFNAMVARLRAVDEMKDEFIADVSHDLRGPVAAIRTCLDYLLHDDPDQGKILPRHREILTALVENATQLSVFVSNTLDAAKMKAGRMEYRLEPVKVQRLAENFRQLYGIVAANKGVSLEIAVPADLPAVRADPVHLERVLTNLLSNALKFTDAGGRIAFNASEDGGEIELSVADTGRGVAEEELARLFQRFEQADRPGRADAGVQGTGLGLYIIKQATEAMGGSVGFESAEGKGTKAWVRLRAERRAPAPAAGHAEGSRSGARILVVDDEPTFADMTKRMLESKGYVVATSLDGAAALALAAREKPDLLLMDMRLRGQTAADVLRRLKGDAATASIPIILCSAEMDLPEVEKTLALGAECFLPKPLRSAELDLRVRQVLEKSSHST